MIYRKQGIVERWENGTHIEVRESGIAIESDDLFECKPESSSGRPLAGRTAGSLPAVVAEIRSMIPNGVTVERLILSRGIAHHEYGEMQWQEETERVHASLMRGEVRVLVDLGAFPAGQRPHEIESIANALSRLDEREQQQPARLRLARNVTAALIPLLIDLAPPNVRLVQTAGGIDGRGNPIVEAAGDWPNWYRPSYRTRPVRMPLNVRMECGVTEIERERPIAVALLASVRDAASRGLSLRVLVDDGEEAWPATVRVARIDAVAAERTWYPYGGGSFGAEMML